MPKKCPICGQGYNDYIKHIWTHKAKTVKWLAAKREEKTRQTSSKEPSLSKKGKNGKYCTECGKKL